MCHVHGVFSLCSFLRTAFLILLGALFNVCAQAQQAPTSQSTPIVITCVSKQGERQVCKADTTAGVVLVRSIGDSECLLGKNWGYDDAGVWVSNGCGGEFGVGKVSRQRQAGLPALSDCSSPTVNCVPTWPHTMTIWRCRTMPPESGLISKPGARSRWSPEPSGE